MQSADIQPSPQALLGRVVPAVARAAHGRASPVAAQRFLERLATVLGIRVNGIAHGIVDAQMWATVDTLFAKFEGQPIGEKKCAVGEAVPLGRMGKPQDLCGAANFLASEEAGDITAQTPNVDGGNWMS